MESTPSKPAVKRIVEDIGKVEEKRVLRKLNSLIAFAMKATGRDQEKSSLICRLRQALQEIEDELISQKIERETYEGLVKLREEEIESLKRENQRLQELLSQQEEKRTKIPQKRRRASKTSAPSSDNETTPTPDDSNKSPPAKAKALPKGKPSGWGLARSQSVTKNDESEKSPTAPVPFDNPLDTIPEREFPEKAKRALKSFNSLPESAEPRIENQSRSTPSKIGRSNSAASDSKSTTPRKPIARSETISSPSTKIPMLVGDKTKIKASTESHGSPKVIIGQRRSALPKGRPPKKERESSVQPAFNFFYNLRKRSKQQK